MQAVVFCGVQGAGKTTFFAWRFAETHIRLSLDMLRTRHRERILVDARLAAKQPFVVDNANPTAAERRRYVEPALTAGFAVVAIYFPLTAREAMEVNAGRPERHRVPVRGVLGTLARLEVPQPGEGFHSLFTVRRDGAGGFVIEPS